MADPACANPLCGCTTAERACGPACGAARVRETRPCPCGHPACGSPAARRLRMPLADADLYPPVLDRFRLERRPARTR